MFNEYYGMPDATVRAFRNQWFHTGDYARMDRDGNIFFTAEVEESTLPFFGQYIRPDMLLFVGPRGSSLAIDVAVLLEPIEIARAMVRAKVEASVRAFASVVPR